MRPVLLFMLMAMLLTATGQESEPVEETEQVEKEKEVTENNAAPENEFETPDRFEATEQLSEDHSAPFPVDI